MNTVTIYANGEKVLSEQKRLISNYEKLLEWLGSMESNFFKIEVRKDSYSKDIIIFKNTLSAIIEE